MEKQNYSSINQMEDQNEMISTDKPTNPTRDSVGINLANRSSNIYENRSFPIPPPLNHSKFISSRYFMVVMSVYFMLLLAVIGSVVFFFIHMKSNEDAMDARFTQLMTKYNELQDQMKFNKYEQQHLDEEITVGLNKTLERLNLLNHSTNVIFSDISNQLTQLANHSNLEVLHKLDETKSQISINLGTVKNHVNAQLSSLTNNVTVMINKSSSSMQVVQDNVRNQLNSTLIQMRQVANTASKKIETVQMDVTSQLSLMDKTLVKTKEYLNISVQQAQRQIQNEVKTVKDNIEQYVAITNKQFAAENDFVKYQLAGTFTLLACLISLWHLTSHIRHYEKPDIQRRVMAVLWMVPIYSITSWLSLVFPKAEYVLSGLRDGFEAYVVYTFIALLVAILQDGESHGEFIDKLTQQIIEENQKYNDAKRKKLPLPEKHLVPPCPCCYNPVRVTSIAVAFLNQCKLMGMQFVIMKPTLAVLPYFIHLTGYDYDGTAPFTDDRQVNWNSAKLYIMIIQNISVAIAFY